MSKPMYCPMAFANRSLTEPRYMSVGDQYGPYVEDVKPWMECTPDCAWAVNNGFRYWCKIAETSEFDTGRTNSRPLKDDAK